MKSLILIFLCISQIAFAEIVGDVVIKAQVIKFDSKIVVIKTETQNLEIPRSAVKNLNFTVGKTTELILDAAAYERLRADHLLKPYEVK